MLNAAADKGTAVVTGASGFVGSHLCAALADRGWNVRAVVRHMGANAPSVPRIASVTQAPMEVATDWSRILEGARAVVHLAARVHRLGDRAADLLSAYRAVNVDGTVRLAEAAARCHVERFVFISTVKVCGESRERPYSDADPADPQDPYSMSKWEAEQALGKIQEKTGLQVVILRPPMVYGPGVKANFLRLMGLVDSGIPLPLGKVQNGRSMIYVGNLVDAIATCIDAPGLDGGHFLVADHEVVSTPVLIKSLARHMGVPARLLPVNVKWLRKLGKCLGKEQQIDRLVSSLVVVTEDFRVKAGWEPRWRLEDGLGATVQWYRKTQAQSNRGG